MDDDALAARQRAVKIPNFTTSCRYPHTPSVSAEVLGVLSLPRQLERVGVWSIMCSAIPDGIRDHNPTKEI